MAEEKQTQQEVQQEEEKEKETQGEVKEVKEEKERTESAIELLKKFGDIPVDIEVVVGKAERTIGELLNMGIGSVVELDREVNDLVDIKVNGKLIARGELVVIENKLGVKIKEIVRD